ncbi:hypothetical protein NE237_008995 [Protea cynaroides]|uniref:Uncharacterized protein n=1 Tax=Protea cynaroides TaxID=273540 RepID=A0A9Q0KWW1_9MAGN|nr:hypothetical protein NE237_008995 [Protea cynaroides]
MPSSAYISWLNSDRKYWGFLFVFGDKLQRYFEKGHLGSQEVAMAVVSGRTSTLNPNAPIFIPAAFRQVDDFSAEWWELVKTSTWFRDYWLSQHQEEPSFISSSVDDDDDIANLLPDSFDLGVDEESSMETQMQEWMGFMEDQNESRVSATSFAKVSPRNGPGTDAEALMMNLNFLKSSNERVPDYVLDPAKYRQKPPQYPSPNSSSRRIQQPR